MKKFEFLNFRIDFFFLKCKQFYVYMVMYEMILNYKLMQRYNEVIRFKVRNLFVCCILLLDFLCCQLCVILYDNWGNFVKYMIWFFNLNLINYYFLIQVSIYWF